MATNSGVKGPGTIEVITGSMFSGKTDELARRVRRLKIARKKFIVFKPSTDDRYIADKVVTHDHVELNATVIPAVRPEEILRLVEDGTDVVLIDEAQFFCPVIVGVCKRLKKMGVKVIIAGLKQDFKGDCFGSMDKLLILADEITLLYAICNVCGEANATMTQRLIDGVPARADEKQVEVGGEEKYQARCTKDYVDPYEL